MASNGLNPHDSPRTKTHKKTILGGSSHLVSGLVHPSYKWINPTKIPFITGVITHLLSGMSHQVDQSAELGQGIGSTACGPPGPS